jgi:hypothetical protein
VCVCACVCVSVCCVKREESAFEIFAIPMSFLKTVCSHNPVSVDSDFLVCDIVAFGE